MQVLIIGRSGQLARELLETKPSSMVAHWAGRDDIDIMSVDSLSNFFTSFSPSLLINASAYTAVDNAENDRENAFALNEFSIRNIAECCSRYNCRLIHVSTDFVFSSQSAITPVGVAPLKPDSPVDPLGVYGESKLAGEMVIRSLLPESSVIVRTAWLYSRFGSNFVKTMLRLIAEKPELRVIEDQIGTPTWAKGLAEWIWAVAEKQQASGVFHWTDAGVASWYDFAVSIQELAVEIGLVQNEIPIHGIPTSQYPTPAKRPSYSVLDKTSAEALVGYRAKHWRRQLKDMLCDMNRLGEKQ